MDIRLARIALISLVVAFVECDDFSYSGLRIMRKIVDECTSKEEMFKCFKIQALKIADRALHQRNLKIFDGVTLVSDERSGRTFFQGTLMNESKLEKLNSDEVDDLLEDKSKRFLETRRLQINFPKMIEEGRKKKGGGFGALAWALAIKLSFLTMAYKGIAVMAGTALLVGKMALMLSAILGLKKLVSSNHHEKTTFEIIKQPKYTETHTHSTSYEDDHDHYHRSYKDYDDPQSRVYRTYIPKN